MFNELIGGDKYTDVAVRHGGQQNRETDEMDRETLCSERISKT